MGAGKGAKGSRKGRTRIRVARCRSGRGDGGGGEGAGGEGVGGQGERRKEGRIYGHEHNVPTALPPTGIRLLRDLLRGDGAVGVFAYRCWWRLRRRRRLRRGRSIDMRAAE